MRALNIDTLPKTNSREFVDCGKLSLADDFRDSTVKNKLSKSNKPFKNYNQIRSKIAQNSKVRRERWKGESSDVDSKAGRPINQTKGKKTNLARGWLKKITGVNGDMRSLPFPAIC
jgi:hypothetical protein